MLSLLYHVQLVHKDHTNCVAISRLVLCRSKEGDACVLRLRQELQRNPALTEYNVQDLNASPVMPYEDNSFDVITNAVSVDYLNKPLEVSSS